MYNFLFRPRRLVDNGGRGRGGVRALQKRVLHPVDQADGEENDHRRPVGGQRGQPLTFGHRGTALHAGDDDGLADAGQRVLGVQRRRRTAEARHAGRIVVGDAHGVQRVHLFPDCAVQAGVARVQAHGGFVRCFVFFHDGKHLLQRHLGAVINGAVRPRQPQQRRVDQAARVDDAVRCLQQGRAAPGNQVRCAGTGPHKMYHVRLPSTISTVYRQFLSVPAGRSGLRTAPRRP